MRPTSLWVSDDEVLEADTPFMVIEKKHQEGFLCELHEQRGTFYDFCKGELLTTAH
jgi:hypothetical protein